MAPAETYLAVPEPAPAQYVPNVRSNVEATAAPEVIGFVRNILNSPAADPSFDYDFESENTIQQSAVGTMKVRFSQFKNL